jgi:hypothetical protein
MQTVWMSPTNFVSGDKSLKISYPSVTHPAVEIKTSTRGDLKWIYLGLRVPSDHEVHAIQVCYQLSNSRSFISQVRLVEMQTPDQSIVRHDDGTNLQSTTPTCYRSPVVAFRPGAAVLLALRLNFRNVADTITLGGIGMEVFSAGVISANYIDALAYGLATTNTGAQNNAAMASAIAAAQAAGKILRIPAGTFKFNTHGLAPTNSGGVPAAIILTSSVVLRGAGMNATILVSDGWVEPTYTDPETIDVQNDNGTALFHQFGLGANVVLGDMTLQGPPAVDLTNTLSNIWGIYSAGGGSLRLERVKTTLWNQIIKFSPNYPAYPGMGAKFSAVDCVCEFRGLAFLGGGIGPHLNYDAQSANFSVGSVLTGGTSGATAIIVDDTDAGATGTLILKQVGGTFVDNETITDAAGGSATANGAVYGGGASIDMLRCEFRYHTELDDLISQLPSTSEARHGLYISNGTSLRTVQCSFLATSGSGGEAGCAWRHYSVGDADVPEYSESIGDYFARNSHKAIITNPNFPTTVIGATIHTQAGEGAIHLSGANAKICGCHFVGERGAVSGIFDGAFTGGSAGIENCSFEGDWVFAISNNNGAGLWKVTNCRFEHSSSSGGSGIRINAGKLDVDGAVFNVQGAGTGGSLVGRGGAIRVGNTRFASGCKYPVFSANLGDLSVEFLPGNVWDDTGSVPLCTADAHNLTLKGQANWPEFSGQGVGLALAGAFGSSLTGQMQCGRGVGAYEYSAGELLVNGTFDTYSINEGGAPVLQTINMKGGLGAGAVVADHLRYYAPTIRLYAQQAFRLGSEGNIVSSGERVEVGSIVTLQLMQGAGKWVQIGTADAGIVDAASFGVKASNTGAENNTAMAAALAAAWDSGIKEIRLPPGRLLFDFHDQPGSPKAAITLTQDTIIRGAGKTLTTLKADGFIEGAYTLRPAIITTANDNGTALFVLAAGAGAVTLSDMTWEGPDVGEITMDLNVCWGLWSGGGNQLSVERVDTLLWNQISKCSPEHPSYPGVGTNATWTDCHLRYRSSSGPLHIAGTDADLDSCDFRRCVFEYDDGGTPTIIGARTSNGALPCFYVNTGVSLSATDCWFKAAGQEVGATASASGWLHYGSGYFMKQNDTPKYARALNCLFDIDIPQTQMYAGSPTETQVIGCTFKTGAGYQAVQAGGPMSFLSCEFLGDDGAGYGIAEVPGHDDNISVLNCTFGRSGQGDGYALQVYRVTAGTKEWRFVNCTFNDIGAGGANVEWNADAKATLDGCTFQGSGGTYAMVVGQGHVAINDCRVKSSMPFYADGSVGAAGSILELNRNRWEVSAATQLQAPSGNPVEVRGADNQFYESTPGIGEGFAIVSSTGVSNITGSILCRPGIGSYTYSSNLLSVSLNHDTFMIDEGGGPTIDDITMYGGSASGVTFADHNRFHNGRIYLLVKQAFTLSGAGNIIAAGGARTVNSIVTLQYFPSLDKWVEV